MYIYEYQFIDISDFIRPVKEMKDRYQEMDDKKIEEIKKLFRNKGWQGDGELGIFWLPPFLWDEGDTMGNFVWHVKQSNNGISFIASRVPLIFGCLSEQNHNRMLTPNIYSVTKDIEKNLENDVDKLNYHIKYLSNSNEDAIIDIKRSLLNAAHSNILVHFEDYLGKLFIVLVDEKYVNYNINIKINSMSVKLKDIDREDAFKNMLDFEKRRVVILDFLSDMYKSFLRDTFLEKLTFINKALKIDDSKIFNSIKTHKTLRNCVQHSHSKMTTDFVRQCDIKILNNLMGEIKLGEKIEFKLETVQDLHDNLLKYIHTAKENLMALINLNNSS